MPPKILTRSLALPEIRFIVALKKFRLDDDSGHKAGLVVSSSQVDNSGLLD